MPSTPFSIAASRLSGPTTWIPRSRTLNSESAIVFENKHLSGQLADMFYQNDLDFSRQITLEDTKAFIDSEDAIYQFQKEFGILLEDVL